MWGKLTRAQSVIIAAIISGIFLCIVAIVGLGKPIVAEWAERQFGETITPVMIPTGPATEPQPISTRSASISKSMFAVLVGVTNETAFSTSDTMNYTYMASVNNVDEAITELGKVFEWNDIVYVVHIPDLRVTPGNPGACKLYLSQVQRLAEYPLGWIIGGDNIVPDEFESGLQFCYDQFTNPTIPATQTQPTISAAIIYVYGYKSNDRAVIETLKECASCQVLYLNTINELPDNWRERVFHSATATANLPDACRTKQELIQMNYTHFIANNYTSCP